MNPSKCQKAPATGYHHPVKKHKRQAKHRAKHRGHKPPFHMADAVNVSGLPAGLPAYAGYVAGSFANFTAIKAAHPGAHVLGITPFASVVSPAAACLDDEPGDATPSQAGSWVVRSHDAGHTRPCVYCDRADLAAVLASIRAARVPRSAYRLWIAHPDSVPHICTPERCDPTGAFHLIPPDATQYLFAGGFDESLCLGDFFDG